MCRSRARCRRSEDQHIDAVGAPGGGVLRQAKRRFVIAPRLGLGRAAVFEFGDDLVGDLLIEVIAVGKGVALRMPGRRAASGRARQFAKADFVGWAHAKNRFKIVSGDSDDD